MLHEQRNERERERARERELIPRMWSYTQDSSRGNDILHVAQIKIVEVGPRVLFVFMHVNTRAIAAEKKTNRGIIKGGRGTGLELRKGSDERRELQRWSP